ncbi:MAG: FkbM family methyltransferase [Acidobacteria bacterium]|nr:MAG: FkbM family methyltransferase [Acidobacteriota bacterium]
MKSLAFDVYRRIVRLFTGTRLGERFPINVAHRLLMRALKPRRVEIAGHRLTLDPHDSLGLSLRPYEPFTSRLVEDCLRPGQVAVDVGANIGYFTLLLARGVGATGRVYAFEPDPESFALLRRNVAANGYGNVIAAQAAVAEEAGTVRLFRSPDNAGDHRTYDAGDGRAAIVVEAVRLDDALADAARVDFIKMDVQGAEPRALAGMRALLERSPRVVLLSEFWPWGLARGGASAAAYLEQLDALGFSLQLIDDDAERLEAVRAKDLLERLGTSFHHHVNLLCRHRPA